VGWLGAVQSQDYPPTLWSLALRLPDTTQTALDRAFDAGRILRTHVLRPTWHFVCPQDIQWMLQLTRHRVLAAGAAYFRRVGLDDAVLRTGRRAIERAVRGTPALTRAEISAALGKAGVAEPTGHRLIFFLMDAELNGVICSGPRAGKHMTYAALDARVRAGIGAGKIEPPESRDEAVAELSRRFFTSHGPATLRDFAWWSGLTQTDGKRGLAMLDRPAEHVELEGARYWFIESDRTVGPTARLRPARRALILPTYDEYVVAYQNRVALFGRQPLTASTAGSRGEFTSVVAIDGQLVGTWRRTVARGQSVMTIAPHARLATAEKRAMTAAVDRYQRFLGAPVALTIR
jgi:winged helix DNA-binding protein